MGRISISDERGNGLDREAIGESHLGIGGSKDARPLGDVKLGRALRG